MMSAAAAIAAPAMVTPGAGWQSQGSGRHSWVAPQAVHWVGSKAGTECGLLRILVALASVCSEGHLETLEGGAEVVLVVACLVGTRAR